MTGSFSTSRQTPTLGFSDHEQTKRVPNLLYGNHLGSESSSFATRRPPVRSRGQEGGSRIFPERYYPRLLLASFGSRRYARRRASG